jgi:hypothetical protein
MVIAPGQNGITAHVCLGDNEALPANLNSEKVVVYRRGKSTDNELQLVKPLGVVLDADHEALRDPTKPICNYSGDGNPLHEHVNGEWFFYEETWAYENGPFPTYDDAYQALAEYCVGLEMAKQAVIDMANERMTGDIQTESESDDSDNRSVDDSSGKLADGVED